MTRLIFLLKKYVLAIFPIFIALFIFKVALFFFYFRYLPPKSSDGLDQKMQRLLIAQETGLLLAPSSLVLTKSDGDFRDGTKGFYFWNIFSSKPINLPTRESSHFYDPGLTESVRIMEAEMSPYKIKDPYSARYQSWDYGTINTRATIINGKYGYYLSIETVRYKK